MKLIDPKRGKTSHVHKYMHVPMMGLQKHVYLTAYLEQCNLTGVEEAVKVHFP